MFKKLKAIWELSKPITHDRLIELGFEYYDPEYVLAGLAITSRAWNMKRGRKLFYYTDTAGEFVQIKSMAELADLIYGVTDYG